MSEHLSRVETKDKGLGAIGVLSIVAASALVGAGGMYLWGPARHEQAEPTVAELFKEANQECANEKVAAVSVTPEQIAQADSLSALTKQINSDVKSAIAACVFERTEIPEGTEGFVIQYPTLELSLDASAVAVTEGN